MLLWMNQFAQHRHWECHCDIEYYLKLLAPIVEVSFPGTTQIVTNMGLLRSRCSQRILLLYACLIVPFAEGQWHRLVFDPLW